MPIFSIISILICVLSLAAAALFIYAGEIAKAVLFVFIFLVNEIFTVAREFRRKEK